MPADKGSKKSAKVQDDQVRVPFYANAHLEGLAVRHNFFTLRDDRKLAKQYIDAIRKTKKQKTAPEEEDKKKKKKRKKRDDDSDGVLDEGEVKKNDEDDTKKEEEELGQPYRLLPLAEIVFDPTYNKEVPRNYIPYVGKVLNMLFLYKIYYRIDLLSRHEKLKQLAYYVKNYFSVKNNKDIGRENSLDWLQIAPLLAQLIRRRRDPYLRVSLAPKTYDCRGILQAYNRRSLTTYFKHEDGFSPLAFGKNASRIQKTMGDRWLYNLYVAYKDTTPELIKEVKAFIAQNQQWKELTRQLARPPLILPTSRFRPYHPCTALNYPGFLGGSYSIFLSEFNQLPPSLLLDYNLCRVRRPLTLEIASFAPRRLVQKNVLTKEKVCDANESCFKVISDTKGVEEHLGALKIRRSVYSNEAANATTFTGIGDVDDEYCHPSADGLCDSDSMESLASLSGWSTDSFASTATLSPGDASYNWQILSKEMCTSYQTSQAFQNPRKWAYLAKLDQSARIACEMDERLLLANGNDGQALYNYRRYLFFQKSANLDRKRNIRRKEDHEKVKVARSHLKETAAEKKELGKMDAVAEGLLETALRRTRRFERTEKTDRYRGLDISPAWTAAIDSGLISEESMERLSHLISSHDSWVTTSPLTDRPMTVRCDQLQLGQRAPLVLGGVFDFLLAVAMTIAFVIILIYR